MTRELFPYQKEGVEFLVKKKRAILADSMGLGKSFQAITAAGRTGIEPTLVVCPASLKINWQREIRMVFPIDEIGIVQGTVKDPAAFWECAWVIVNYDVLGKNPWLLEWAKVGRFSTVIFDEAHYIKDTKTIRTKAALAIAEHVDQVYCLTGTPVMNRPIELFALLRAVRHPLAYSDEKAASTLRKEFGKRYCAAYFHRLGYTGRGFWDETGSSRLPELRELTKGVFLRRTKAEVLDLPEKIISVVPCELSAESKKEYAGAWSNYLEWIAAHPGQVSIDNALSAQAMIELGKLKQVCSRAKVERIADDVANAVEQGEKVIIFTQFTDTVYRLHMALAKRDVITVTLTGADDSEQRQAAVDAFQTQVSTMAMVANIKAGGVGLNLTAASIVMFADMDWSPETHRQAEDRAHRIGQAGTVNVYYYVADGTIEEDIIDILTAKQETIGVLTGGETTIPAFMERLSKRAGVA